MTKKSDTVRLRKANADQALLRKRIDRNQLQALLDHGPIGIQDLVHRMGMSERNVRRLLAQAADVRPTSNGLYISQKALDKLMEYDR